MTNSDTQLPFQVSVTLTDENFIAAHVVLYSAKRTLRKRLRSIGIAAAVGGVFGWYWAATHVDIALATSIAGCAIAAGALLFCNDAYFSPVFLRGVARAGLKARIKRGAVPFLGPQQVTFDTTGVTGESTLSSLRLNWSSLTSRVDDAERIYLFAGGSAFVALPRRDLLPTQLAAIEHAIARYMPVRDRSVER
ncbi:YcxB family protein [Paraburkholderia bryophila]|uniref:YcxB family protein n=1 Tax=Paraburkholderia bryophila TaxID=420952 RepID=UPI00234B0D5B|nr:YcxB family protein [Paraburkholderia bryophila]WCM17975.1 YcxB family protein [Paraburkholderia bryophila]